MIGPCQHCGKQTNNWGFWDGHDANGRHTHGTFFDCGCTYVPPTKLGKAIRCKRVDNELSLRDVATRARLAPVELSGFERGSKYPTDEQIKAVADVIGVDASDWLAIAKDERP